VSIGVGRVGRAIDWSGLLLFLLGIAPYVALSFVVVVFWDKHIGFVVPESVDFLTYTSKSLFSIHNVLGILSMFGSWVVWKVFCRVVRFVFMPLWSA